MLRVARAVVTVAVLAALAYALATRWDEVRGQLGQVSPAAIAGALAYALLALLASMLAWRALLADLGSPLPVAAATRVLFLGQLAKYLPGSSVWAMVAQTELARDFGVPRRRAAAAALVLNLVTLGVGILVALLALPRLLSDDAPGWLHWSPLLLPVGLACLAPPVLSRVCDLLFRALRRPPLDVRFSWRGIGTAVLALLGTWLAYGLQVTLLGWSLGADPASLLVPATGAFAAAWCAGFLVVVVPTGAGTREAVLTVALAAQLPGGSAAALTIAVVSRLLLTVADVLAALAGMAMGRRRAPGVAPAADDTQPARSLK
ncbi:MAG TPA: lysylphosphatidylglycerol synthase domain-containing protein [Mycobacteriales bacterium]|nr:lysylphosphatidylglycerol synthase domain-containing protein [Mycobacteriales bacterium]